MVKECLLATTYRGYYNIEERNYRHDSHKRNGETRVHITLILRHMLITIEDEH